jgi:heme-degrading monooxygenase HmoA
MIVRLWKGRARGVSADAYQGHVLTSVFPKLRRIDGYVGGRVLRRNADGDVVFLVETTWASLNAIRAFAGDTLDRAVVEPAARALLTEFDSHVEHFEVVDGGSGPE